MNSLEEDLEIDFNLCIKCQVATSEHLVENPKSLRNLLNKIAEYSDYGDSSYVAIDRKIKQYMLRFPFLPNIATYHRTCYQEAIHKKKSRKCKKKVTMQK